MSTTVLNRLRNISFKALNCPVFNANVFRNACFIYRELPFGNFKHIKLGWFSNDSERAIVLSHEMGHVLDFLTRGTLNFYSTPVFINECIAWERAEALLIKLGYFRGNEYIFGAIKNYGLSEYDRPEFKVLESKRG